ncbi:MAG: hypothetical protein H8E44_22895 [Planctomycetes bacterium]|nr:hypothetical protein [Planctomycetota bacterium]MBL7039461.1 hypothetical protein [Pirellulaceae bacterium]
MTQRKFPLAILFTLLFLRDAAAAPDFSSDFKDIISALLIVEDLDGEKLRREINRLDNREERVRAYLGYVARLVFEGKRQEADNVLRSVTQIAARLSPELETIRATLAKHELAGSKRELGGRLREIPILFGIVSGKGSGNLGWISREPSLPTDRPRARSGSVVVLGRNAGEIARLADKALSHLTRKLGLADARSRDVTIVVANDKADMRFLLEEVYGVEHAADQDENWGFSVGIHNTVFYRADLGGGTVGHELVHLLIYNHLPTAPPWFEEGLASLFEEFAFKRGTIVGTLRLGHWRMEDFPITNGKFDIDALPEISQLSKMTWDQLRKSESNTLAAKMFCLFVQEEHGGRLGQLAERLGQIGVERDFVAMQEKILSDVLGSSYEADWREWLADQLGTDKVKFTPRS